jgi:hypothetical protein
MRKEKQVAIGIIDLLEDFLYERDIYIPDVDRRNPDIEACIFGSVYSDLEDAIILALPQETSELITEDTLHETAIAILDEFENVLTENNMLNIIDEEFRNILEGTITISLIDKYFS